MGPDHLKFGGGVTQTVLNPAILLLILIAGVLICVWPRRRALAAFLAASILIPMDQVLLLGPLHFPMLRILILFGIVRMVREKSSTKRKLLSGGVNRIDIAFFLLTIFIALNGILLFQESGAVVYQLGNLYTGFGVYFLLRFLIRDEGDIVSAIQTLAYIAAAVAVVMSYELATGHNPYALLGGANAQAYATLMERDGKLRAVGCFSIPFWLEPLARSLFPYSWACGGRHENTGKSRSWASFHPP